MKLSKRAKEYLTTAITDKEVANEVEAFLNLADKLGNQMEALLQKLDSDAGVSDTDFESTISDIE